MAMARMDLASAPRPANPQARPRITRKRKRSSTHDRAHNLIHHKRAYYLALNTIRHDTRKKRTPEPEILKLRPDVIGPDEQVEQEELRQQVLGVLRELPEEYRVPLTLRYLVGADYETIQTQLGLSKGAVRGLLHRGIGRLRAEMQKLLGDNYPQSAAE